MLTFSCRSPESAFDSVSYLLLPAGPPLIPVQKTTTSHKSISGRLPGRTYPKVVMMQEAFKGQGFTSCMLTWRRVGGGGQWGANKPETGMITKQKCMMSPVDLLWD